MFWNCSDSSVGGEQHQPGEFWSFWELDGSKQSIYAND